MKSGVITCFLLACTFILEMFSMSLAITMQDLPSSYSFVLLKDLRRVIALRVIDTRLQCLFGISL